jgi:hypothetical protein
MCNPFFSEFRAILAANVFQLVCYIANLFTTEAVARRLNLIGIFLTIAGGELQGGMICFVMETCKSGLLGQGLLSSSNSNYAWHAGPVL